MRRVSLLLLIPLPWRCFLAPAVKMNRNCPASIRAFTKSIMILNIQASWWSWNSVFAIMPTARLKLRISEQTLLLEEMKGKYKVENKQLISYDTQRRLITQEGTWTPPKKEPSAVELRKIKKGSYQYYFKLSWWANAWKIQGTRLAEGWKTYKRISD